MFIKKTYIYIYIAIQVTNITCFPNFFSKQNLKNILSTKSGKIGTCILASLISFSIYLKSEEIYYNYKKKIFIKEFISWFMSKANIVFNNKFLYPYLNKIKKKSLETYLKNIQSKKLIMHVQQLEKNYGLKQLQKQEILNQLLQQENKLLIQQVLQEIKSQPQEQLNQQIKQLQKQIEQLSQEIKQLEQKEEEQQQQQEQEQEQKQKKLKQDLEILRKSKKSSNESNEYEYNIIKNCLNDNFSTNHILLYELISIYELISMNGKLINANFTKEHYEMLKYIFEDKIEKQMAIKILKIFRGHNIKKKKQQQQQQQ